MSDHAKLSAELAINARKEFFQDAQNAKNHDKNIVKVGSALLELDPHRTNVWLCRCLDLLAPFVKVTVLSCSKSSWNQRVKRGLQTILEPWPKHFSMGDAMASS